MGLDMYLKGRKFHWTNWENQEADEKQEGFRVEETILSLGYWRKHPNLHGYIVNTYGPKDADGKRIDDCSPIPLGKENLEDIIKAVAEHRLPGTEGFFFGASSTDDEQDTTAQLTKAIEWLEKEDTTTTQKKMKSIEYQASW